MTTTVEKTFNIFDILIGTEGDEDVGRKPVIIQGMTGSYGSTHTRLMKAYGTNIAAGVTPGKGGQRFEGTPVYNTMSEAVKATGAQISGIFVPAPFFLKAAIEAIDSGIKLLVAIPEHIPIIDSIKVLEYARKNGARMIGPNTPGVIVPEVMKVGIMPAQPFKAGTTVVFSRSGTLMYDVSYNLTSKGFGQRLCLGIGGDPINGTNLIEAFDLVRDRADIDSIVVVGEIGGDAEEQLDKLHQPCYSIYCRTSSPKGKENGPCWCNSVWELWVCRIKSCQLCKGKCTSCKASSRGAGAFGKEIEKVRNCS
jgi:succinyl-CoA synthetase alpha subunit